MKRLWTRRDRLSDLEKQLRDQRPRPSEELIRRVTHDASPARSTPRLRLGLATAVSGIALAAVVALGGLNAPIDTAGRIMQFDNAGGKSKGHGKGHGHGKPAHHQYQEKVTICHRPPGNPSNGQTLTLSRSGADAHLRNHRGDTRGACPPKPKPKPKGKPGKSNGQSGKSKSQSGKSKSQSGKSKSQSGKSNGKSGKSKGR